MPEDVCESCLEAAMDELEGFGEEPSWQVAVDICIGLGRDLPDHVCNEEDTGVPCACTCHRSSSFRRQHGVLLVSL